MKTPAYPLIGAVSIYYLFTHLPGSQTGAFVTFTGVLMLALAATDEVSSEQVFEGLDQVLWPFICPSTDSNSGSNIEG